MRNLYDFLKPYCTTPDIPGVVVAPFNCFGPVDELEIAEAETLMGFKFPSQLIQFYREIGCGSLMKPHIVPDNYDFSGSNEILPPMTVARFATGTRFWEDQDHWIAESTHEDLEPGDLPFFEIGDSTRFLVMKALSDNPNAVWTDGVPVKIEDSLERFIWRLYYERPSYYDDIVDAWLVEQGFASS